MKAILVIDKPENCDDCQLMHSYYDHDYGWIKKCVGSGVNDCIVFKKKLEDYCPLKPIPKKKPTLNTYVVEDMKKQIVDIHSVGWNDCIDELLGAEDEE